MIGVTNELLKDAVLGTQYEINFLNKLPPTKKNIHRILSIERKQLIYKRELNNFYARTNKTNYSQPAKSE